MRMIPFAAAGLVLAMLAFPAQAQFPVHTSIGDYQPNGFNPGPQYNEPGPLQSPIASHHSPYSEYSATHHQYGMQTADVDQLASRITNLEAQINSVQGGGCGCDCCGDSCWTGDCGPIARSRGGFYVGGGVVFARPHFKESFQYSQINVLTGQQTLFAFDYDYDTTPRFWVGYKTPGGTGVQARYWQFDASGQSSLDTSDGLNIFGAHAVTIIFPANIFADQPGETLATQNSLATETFDLYGTTDFSLQGVATTAGIGLRYANLSQAISAQVLNTVPASFTAMSWLREYEGLGPSVSVDAKKRLGHSPLSIFTSANGSFLFGTKTLDRQVFGDQSPQPASPFLSLGDADEVVGLGELGIGLEMARVLCNGSQLTLRGSYEGSLWAEAGAPTLGFLGFEGFGITAQLAR